MTQHLASASLFHTLRKTQSDLWVARGTAVGYSVQGLSLGADSPLPRACFVAVQSSPNGLLEQGKYLQHFVGRYNRFTIQKTSEEHKKTYDRFQQPANKATKLEMKSRGSYLFYVGRTQRIIPELCNHISAAGNGSHQARGS